MPGVTYPRPSNVQGRFGAWVDSDVFHIAERCKELNPNLRIQTLDPPITINGEQRNFAIVEMTGADGSYELVYRAPALDGRVIEYLEYLLQVPFEKRFAEAERLADKQNAAMREAELDTFTEEFAHEFRGQLARNGFITHTGTSYPLRGRAAARARAGRVRPSGLIIAGA